MTGPIPLEAILAVAGSDDEADQAISLVWLDTVGRDVVAGLWADIKQVWRDGNPFS